MNKKTFKLDAPPIAGNAPDSVISYLRESTKCWQYGFHGASVVLSRACLEETLKTKIPDDGKSSRQLDALIDQARQRRLLDDCMATVAYAIRAAGNNFVHGKAVTESGSRDTLDATRGIVEHVFSS